MNTPHTSNADLMRQARESLAGKWGLAIGTSVVYFLISGVAQSVKGVGPFIGLLIAGPLALGMALFWLSISRNKDAQLEQLFHGFRGFGRSLAAYLLVFLFTFLWSLLLFIPGIVAGLRYSQTFFILADDESIGAKAAIDKSKKIMYGYKWKYFCLQWRFIGWILLSILTLGIGLLWLIPYIQVTSAKFYDSLREQA